ncbi:MAG TPA: MFS transporter [Vicinamibacterales bacterium]|nr:MFS transporter [Vicinamibacterales bacterium]
MTIPGRGAPAVREPSAGGAGPASRGVPVRRPIRGLRWWIAVLLFGSTVINYIDRQTLSVLAPYLESAFSWTNTDFALVIVAFRAAYALGQAVAGRALDRVGTRAGLSVTVAFYSIAAMLTSLATGLWSFCGMRFLLGAGESANWPGATKAVAEWFPRSESGWAVAFFDSGSSIGAVVAPFLVLWLYHAFGTWRPAFIITGCLGFAWLLMFRRLYYPPSEHPRISPEELAYIQADHEQASPTDPAGARLGYRTLLALPQTWGIVLGKALTDPVWFFLTDWLAIYLVSRGFRLETSLLAFWIPFLAADAGNFVGGGVSSFLIRRGCSVGGARRLVIVLGGVGMSMLAFAVLSDSLVGITLAMAVSTLAYAAMSTMILNLPADLYPSSSVASVSGLSGTGAGIGTMIVTLLTGVISDRYSFAPVLVGASLLPLVAAGLVVSLVRNNEATARGIVRSI